jgi:prepilin-type N-terminal cleavage/methylation domain-containing protein
MNTRRRNPRGVTIVELLVAMVILAVIGGAVLKLIVRQANSMENQEAWRGARAVSRSSINLLLADARMVEARGGLDAATANGKDFTLRVPYAFGLVCKATGTATLSLLPVDSAMFNSAAPSGLAYRDMATGTYTYVTSGVSITANPGTTSNCTNAPASITTVPAAGPYPAGQIINLNGIPNGTAEGTIVFLYRTVRYEFKASAALSGRIGLWRTVGGVSSEIAAPFDTSARAAFYVLNNATPQIAAPSPLSDARGLELRLNGASEGTPRGSPAPKKSNITTSVFFTNRPD